MKVTGVRYILAAKDMDRVLAFWRNTFGFEKLLGNEFWSEVDAAGSVIAFHGGHDGSKNVTGLVIEVDEIEDAAAECARNGATVTMAPEKRGDEGIYLAGLIDPEGNTFNLSQMVGDS